MVVARLGVVTATVDEGLQQAMSVYQRVLDETT
jgi:hypothetical protein